MTGERPADPDWGPSGPIEHEGDDERRQRIADDRADHEIRRRKEAEMPIYEATDIPRVRVLGERIEKFTRQRDILAAALRRLRNIHPLVLADAQAFAAAVDIETERALREAGMEVTP